MRRIALYSALALLLGAALLRMLQHDAGYVLIAVAGKTIEMRFWFALFLVIIIGVVVMWVLRTLLRVIRAVSGGWSLAMANRARRGELRTNTGLIQFIEGDWLGAQKSLLKAAKDVDEPLVHYLAAARSSYETGNFEKAENLIAKAQKIAPDDNAVIAISQARMLFLSEKYDQCLSILHGIKTSTPNHPVVLSLLQKSYLAIGDWLSLEGILPSLKRQQVLPDDEWLQLQTRVYLHLLEAAGKIEPVKTLMSKVPIVKGEGVKEQGDTLSETVSKPTNPLDAVWQRAPKNLKQTSSFVALYGRMLLNAERHEDAQLLLRNALKKQWSDAVVEIYGLTMPVDFKTQLRVLEGWLKIEPENATLHLALGRVCLRSELWGQAKGYFQSSLTFKQLPTAYAELARLQAALGEQEQSALSYEKGLLMTTNGLPDLPLPSL